MRSLGALTPLRVALIGLATAVLAGCSSAPADQGQSPTAQAQTPSTTEPPSTRDTIAEATAAADAGDGARALALLRPLAEIGNTTAQLRLGDLYYEGSAVPQNYAAAVDWYMRAAAAGATQRLQRIGQMHAEGQGVPENEQLAQQYWRQALAAYLAESETDPAARRNAALMIARGQGTMADGPRAIAMLQPLAASGDAAGLVALGDIYYAGSGVERDLERALALYRQATAGGNTTRTERIAQIEGRLGSSGNVERVVANGAAAGIRAPALPDPAAVAVPPVSDLARIEAIIAAAPPPRPFRPRFPLRPLYAPPYVYAPAPMGTAPHQ